MTHNGPHVGLAPGKVSLPAGLEFGRKADLLGLPAAPRRSIRATVALFIGSVARQSHIGGNPHAKLVYRQQGAK